MTKYNRDDALMSATIITCTLITKGYVSRVSAAEATLGLADQFENWMDGVPTGTPRHEVPPLTDSQLDEVLARIREEIDVENQNVTYKNLVTSLKEMQG